MAKISVFVVDGYEVVRRGLKCVLCDTPDLEYWGEASGENEAITTLNTRKESPPRVVVTEFAFPQGSALELMKDVKHMFGDSTEILVYTGRRESFYASHALLVGALGYVEKRCPSAKLVAAIRKVAAGKQAFSLEMSTHLIRRKQENGSPTPSIQILANRELEVFNGIGNGLTTREIAANLGLSPKTIETYREFIKTKLGFKNGAELVHQAIRHTLENNGEFM